MRKEYRYRPHIRWGQYIIPIASGGFLLCCWMMLLILWIIDSSLPPMLMIIVGLLVPGIFGLEGGLLWWVFYRMAGISVMIDDTAILIDVGKRSSRLMRSGIWDFLRSDILEDG